MKTCQCIHCLSVGKVQQTCWHMQAAHDSKHPVRSSRSGWVGNNAGALLLTECQQASMQWELLATTHVHTINDSCTHSTGNSARLDSCTLSPGNSARLLHAKPSHHMHRLQNRGPMHEPPNPPCIRRERKHANLCWHKASIYQCANYKIWILRYQ